MIRIAVEGQTDNFDLHKFGSLNEVSDLPMKIEVLLVRI